MTIAEMNKVIEDMQKMYQFKDEHTHICIGDIVSNTHNRVEITTVAEDETTIIMSKRV